MKRSNSLGTQIDGRTIPVQPGPRTIVVFSHQCHPADPPGPYEFWAAQNQVGAVVGRRPAGRDPGERFRTMEGATGHESLWAAARTAVLVRPATRAEVLAWLNSHLDDAPCAGECEVNGIGCRITRLPDGQFGF